MEQMNSDYEADLVVVGAGNAALCAAISARESGAKVLVLERAPKHKRGGNSFFTDGAIRFAYNGIGDIRKIVTDLTEEDVQNIIIPPYKQEDYYNDLMRVTEGKSDPELAKQLVKNSYQTVSWMRDHGVNFELSYENQSFENNGKRQFWGGLPVKTRNKGVGLIQQLNERVKELGIEVFYDARAIKLVRENGKITSIVVQQGDRSLNIKTAGVVLACGGFEANQEMRTKYMGPEWESAIVRGTEYNTGDGLEMALAVGAQKYGDWSGCHSIGTDLKAPKVGDFTKPGDIYKKHSYPLGIMVNIDGKRFVDEGADFRNYTYAKYGREILKQPKHMAYQIFDAQVRPLLRNEYNLQESTFYQADSLEKLADFIRIDKFRFLETVKTYNEAVQKGAYNPTEKDGKGTKGIDPPKTNWALAIEEGPFYAFPVTCGVTFSFGGLHVNPDGEVLNEQGQAIGGLFAAGEMIGGIFYENYPGGSGLMLGSVFGRIAGETAGKYVGEKKTAAKR